MRTSFSAAASEYPDSASPPRYHTAFFSSLDRLFDLQCQPNEQDIIRSRARTIGIIETNPQLGDNKVVRRANAKDGFCFQDVTSFLSLVSLSGYDQCLVEDKDSSKR